MAIQEIATKVVQLCNEGRDAEVVNAFFADDVVSIEGAGTEDMPARAEGIDAIRSKHVWWYENHTVHGAVATGPFIGHRDDQFAVKFDIDATPKGGERMQMSEIALFTVRDGRIVQEEFLYQM